MSKRNSYFSVSSDFHSSGCLEKLQMNTYLLSHHWPSVFASRERENKLWCCCSPPVDASMCWVYIYMGNLLDVFSVPPAVLLPLVLAALVVKSYYCCSGCMGGQIIGRGGKATMSTRHLAIIMCNRPFSFLPVGKWQLKRQRCKNRSYQKLQCSSACKLILWYWIVSFHN